MKVFKSLLLLIVLSLCLTACNGTSKGPTADTKCVDPENTSSSGTSTGTSTASSSGGTAAKIDAALRSCKIITTIINKVKAEVIGQNGFGTVTSVNDSGSNSSCGDTDTSNDESAVGASGIFTAFVSSTEFQGAIGAAFTLYVIFYGVAVATGMAQASMGEALIRVAKLAAVAALATSWGFFYQVIGQFFINGTDEIIGYFLKDFSQFYQTPTGAGGAPITDSATASASPTDNIFTSLDNFTARIFSYQTYAFIVAMFSAGPTAPVYAILLGLSLFWVFQSVIKIVSIYVFSLFGKALLFAVAPMFLIFLLFKQTQPLFDAWVRQLVAFSLQPIMIMAFVGLFSQLLTPFFTQFSSYKLCWFQLGDAADKYNWKFVQNNGSSNYQTIDSGSNSAPPVGLQTVLLFAFFAWLFYNTLEMVNGIVENISNSKAAQNLSQLTALSNILKSENKGPKL